MPVRGVSVVTDISWGFQLGSLLQSAAVERRRMERKTIVLIFVSTDLKLYGMPKKS